MQMFTTIVWLLLSLFALLSFGGTTDEHQFASKLELSSLDEVFRMFGMQNGGEGFEKETAAEENNFKRKNDELGDEKAQKAQKLQKIAKIKDENLEHFDVAAASCKKMKISKLDFGKIGRAVHESAPQSRLPRIETAGENNFKRKTEFGDEEAQKGQKLQKIAKIKDENLEHFDVSAASCKKIEISKLDFGKISRAFHYFAQSRLYRMELIDKMISAISLRESIAKRQILNPSQATAFSLQKLHVFSAGKAVDMAMLGIEIAMLPFENLWQNGQGERVEMAGFVSEKFGFLACAVMGMGRPAKAVLKEIMGVMREFLRGNDKKHLMTALAVVNDIEKFVDGIPTRNGQVQNNEKLMNLDFYIEYFNKMGRMCSPPIVSATIVNSSPWFRNLCQKVQLFTTALVDEFSRIRKK